MSKRNATQVFLIVLLELLLIFCIGAFYKAKAQDIPPVSVNFTVSCQSTPDNVIVLVEADGADTYGFYANGTAPIQTDVPSTFTTHVGKYVLGHVNNAYGNIIDIHFTKEGFDGALPASDFQTFCDPGYPVINPEPTNEAGEQCPSYAWAIDATFGGMICLWELPPPPVMPVP